MQDIDETIRVYIRQRPSSGSEEKQQQQSHSSSSSNGTYLTSGGGSISNCSISGLSNNESGVRSLSEEGECCYFTASSKKEQSFGFDGCFGTQSSQQQVYDTSARPIVESALAGYSGTIFAYGPTNSGKTFTMRGSGIGEEKVGLFMHYAHIF